MRTALIADADEDTRRILTVLLKLLHFGVLEASTAEGARSLYGTHTVDLIVLNHPMKLASGLTLTRALRQSESGHDVPILNFTSRVTPDSIADAAADGVDLSLSKPAHIDTIRAAIRRLVT